MIKPGRRNTLIDFIAHNLISMINDILLTYFNIYYCVILKIYDIKFLEQA